METRSRYGRTVKKPERYEPQETCEDDYSGSDCEDHLYDDVDIEKLSIKKLKKKSVNKRTVNLEEDSDGETIGSESESESDDGSDSEADDDGNLKGFVCYSDSEDEDEDE